MNSTNFEIFKKEFAIECEIPHPKEKNNFFGLVSEVRGGRNLGLSKSQKEELFGIYKSSSAMYKIILQTSLYKMLKETWEESNVSFPLTKELFYQIYTLSLEEAFKKSWNKAKQVALENIRQLNESRKI